MDINMERKKSGTLLGATSLIMIFIVVSLTTFSILSLVTANADYKLSKKAAASVTAFYQADGEGEEKFSEIINAMTGSNEKETKKILKSLDVTVKNSDENTIQAVYIIPMNERQELEVIFSLLSPFDGTHYSIDSWKVLSKVDANSGNDLIDVWDGLSD